MPITAATVADYFVHPQSSKATSVIPNADLHLPSALCARNIYVLLLIEAFDHYVNYIIMEKICQEFLQKYYGI